MSDELEQAPELTPEAEKPKRRTRAKKTGEETPVAPVDKTASVPSAVPDGPEVNSDAEAVPAAPKKTTRKRSTAAKKKTETVEVSSESAAAVAEIPVSEAAETQTASPRKTTRKRSTKKPVEAEVELSAQISVPAVDEKASAAMTPESSEKETALAEEEAPSAPKPRRRRTRADATRERGEEAAAVSLGDALSGEEAAAKAKPAAATSQSAAREPNEVVETSAALEAAAANANAAAPAADASAAANAASVGVVADEAPAETLNRPKRDRGDRKKKSKQNQAASSGEENGSSNQQGQKNPSNQNQGKNKGSFDRDHRRQRRPHGNREVLPSISRDEFAEMKVGDLREKAAEYGIDASGYRKAELIDVVFEALCKAEGIIEVTGILDVMNDGYGFLRTKGYLPNEGDAYVSLSIIRRNNLRKGDFVVGLTRPAQGNEKYAAIQKIISVNDIPADELGGRVRFADLTPIYPDERLIMEHGKSTTTARVIDMVSPIGKGQRGLIVSPPKAGKTTVLKDIAAAISANNPEVHLMCLLVDERPEEVTDMERSIKGEVISSTFDKPCENHIAVAELVIERAKRLVEQGRDVVILLDSITRLARAYNMGTPASGRILSGGVDSSALYPPKRFLGAARNIEHGGSLTILGTALVDTGSKMDEVIFEEFKGTGNMELKLDRTLADRRIFPAIDPIASGTRKEELLLDLQEAPLIWAVRRVLANLNNTERAMDTLVKSIKQTETNQEFLIRFARKAQTSTKQDSLDL